MSYKDIEIDTISILWKNYCDLFNTNCRWESIDILIQLKDIIEPYEFDILTIDVDSIDFVDLSDINELKDIISEYKSKRYIDIKYKDGGLDSLLKAVDIKYVTQLWKYAKRLEYGTDVDLGGGEYCQTSNFVNEEKYYKYLIKLYDILNPYENIIGKFDITSTILPSDITNFLYDCKSICNSYHKEVESIRNIINPQHEYTRPSELENDEAKAIFNRCVEEGLFEKTTTGYKRVCTKQLLAYFANEMSLKFNLSNKLDKDGKKTINWKIFEEYFNEKDLKGAKNSWMKTNTLFTPTGFEQIDKVIKIA